MITERVLVEHLRKILRNRLDNGRPIYPGSDMEKALRDLDAYDLQQLDRSLASYKPAT